ncbi:MAG: hypothetical protein AB1744_15915, partial [Candidatus Zixiibacteriota bacterium]
ANNPGKGSVPYVRVAAELVSADHMVGDKLPPYARRDGPLLSQHPCGFDRVQHIGRHKVALYAM